MDAVPATDPPGVPAKRPASFDAAAMAGLLTHQSGVISRDQLVRIGARDFDLERLLRRTLTTVLPGVYVNHTGQLTWLQRAWVAVLACWPAALAGNSALRAAAGPGWRGHRDDAPIEVAVLPSRTLVARPGIRVRRRAGLAARAMWNASPPRVRAEEAVLDVTIETRDEWDQIERLAQAVRSRVTTAERLAAALRARARVRGRTWLMSVLGDIGEGTASVLEQGYLERVERAHQLPTADRQLSERTAQGKVYRDAPYVDFDLLVELDGMLWHDEPDQRDRDLDRDLDSAVAGRRTVRLGWGQVFERPCRTAKAIGLLLREGGWTGVPQRCGPDCRLQD